MIETFKILTNRLKIWYT